MKARFALLVMLLVVPAAWATEIAPETSPVLALAPADALGVTYVASPADLYAHPFWRLLQASADPAAARLLATAADNFRGPTMLAVCGSPLSPMTIRLEFATQPQDGPAAFFSKLEDAGFATMVRAAAVSGAGETDGGLWTLQLTDPMPFFMYASAKDDVVYGSSRLGDVQTWLAGAALPARFADGDDARRLSDDALAATELFIYVNTRPLMPLARAPFDAKVPHLYEGLGLDGLEFAALGGRFEKLDFQLTFGIAQGTGGVFDLIVPCNRPLEDPLLRLPPQYQVVVRTALRSQADRLDDINRILSAIDPDIVAEFRQECEEFRAEFGFHPVDDFLANLVDDGIFGTRIDADGAVVPVGAIRLADEAAFHRHASALIREFALEVETTQCGDVVVNSAAAATGVNLAWTTFDGKLIVSTGATPICEVLEYQAGEEAASISPAFREVMDALPAEAAKLAFVNVSSLAAMAADEIRDDPTATGIVELMEKLGESDTGFGVAVTRDDDAVTIHTAASGAGAAIRQATWDSIEASLRQARAAAARAVTMANMQGILRASFIYANDHKGVWPGGLGVLLQEDLVTPEIFRSPLDDSEVAITIQNVDREAAFLYRDGTGLPPTEVVLCGRELHDNGAPFGFADGHVEWIEGDRARDLHRLMQNASR